MCIFVLGWYTRASRDTPQNKQMKNNQQQKQNKKQQLPFSVKCIEPHHPSHWKCALQKPFIVVVVIIIIMNSRDYFATLYLYFCTAL